MTGHFVAAPRDGVCTLSQCHTKIAIGDQVYLFKKIERQMVCLACAKARWGYSPGDAPPTPPRRSSRESFGFDSTRTILKRLQQSNANDPKMRQAGDR